MRVLVTGGAGYVGSVTVRLLLDEGHQITVLDSLERGSKGAVDHRARLVIGDVCEDSVLDTVLPEIDAVLHLAGYALVAESQAQPGRYFGNNVSAPLVMLEAMVRHKVSMLAFSSTAAVYGEPETIPITEEAPKRPANAYGASKLMFEQLLDWYGRIHGLRSVRFRYFNVAGAWPDGSMGEWHEPETHIIPRLLLQMARGTGEFVVHGGDYPTPDGTCIRDYIHVLDLARAHSLGLEWLFAGGDSTVFNLGNERGFSNLEVARICAEVVGLRLEIKIGPRRPGDPAQLVASSAAATRVLGWHPERAELKQMIADAWRWHESHPRGYPGDR